NMLAADLVRFDGANQDIIWNGFASSGLGEGATGAPADTDPTPSFHSPFANTDPATPLPDTFQILPDTQFHFLVNGKGWGSQKFTASFKAGKSQDLKLKLPQNVASAALGAVASGDGVNLARINDDTESTDWASLDGVPGKEVTIDLAGDQPVNVQSVNVSALLRPAVTGDVDTGAQNRFSALRSFAILACNATSADCTQ